MSSRIDYSKWDNLELSDDDSINQGSSGGGRSGVRVTRLDSPSSVTFGGRRKEVTAVSKNLPCSSKPLVGGENPSPVPLGPPSQVSQSVTESKGSPPPSWVDKGGAQTLDNGTQLFWSQDRYSVTLRLAITSGERKHWFLQLKGHVSAFRDRNVAVSSERARLIIWRSSSSDGVGVGGSTFLVDDTIPYPVHWEEGCEEDEEVDWSIEEGHHLREGSVYFAVTLHKASPMDGLVLWWKRPLEQCKEIDPQIAKTSSSTSMEFQQTWKDAHEQFRQKMSGKQSQRQLQEQQQEQQQEET